MPISVYVWYISLTRFDPSLAPVKGHGYTTAVPWRCAGLLTDVSLLSVAIAVVIIGSLRLQKPGAMIAPTCPEKNAPRHGVHEVSSSDGAAQLKRQTAEYIVVPQGVSLSSARPEMTRIECSRQVDKTWEEALTAKRQLSQKPKANQRQDGSSVQVQCSITRQLPDRTCRAARGCCVCVGLL